MSYAKINRAEIIKNNLPMRQVLERYGFDSKRRMKCPLHGGDDDNFVFKDDHYYCFSHCGGGDVIDFVAKLFGLSFQDAIRKLDTDFALGLFERPTLRQKYLYSEREKERARQRVARKAATAAYDRALSDFCKADVLLTRTPPPQTPDDITPEFANALKNVARLSYELEEAREREQNECTEYRGTEH